MGEIGSYLEPSMIDMNNSSVIDPMHPSHEDGIIGPLVSEVTLLSGETVYVDQNGMIVGYK